MKIYRLTYPTYLPVQPPHVITMGNFDAVHLGHQALLRRVKEKSADLSCGAAVLTFIPSPQAYFSEKAQICLTFHEKMRLFEQAGIDSVYVLRFNKALAECTPEAFVHTVLQHTLTAEHVVLGIDAHFGHHRAGSYRDIEAADLACERVSSVMLDGMRISTTRLKAALAEGDFLKATALLGRPFALRGKVCKGAGRGRELGFPTANLRIPTHHVLKGVFAVTVDTPQGKALPAVANIGTRPTLDGMNHWLEVHVLHTALSLYGHEINVRFITKIRDEQKFSSLASLKAQIQRDITQAQAEIERGKHDRL